MQKIDYFESAEACASANPGSRLLEHTQIMESVDHQDGSKPHHHQRAKEHHLSDSVIRRLSYSHPRFQPLLVLGQTVQTEAGPQVEQDEC